MHTGNTDSRDMLGYMARKLIESCKTSSGGTTSKSLTSLDSNNILVDNTDSGNTKINDEIRIIYMYIYI